MKLRYKILAGIGATIGVTVLALAVTLSYSKDCAPAPPIAEGIATMKAVVHRCYGSPDVLTYEDVPKPAPTPGQVLVRIHAAAVNPYDWHGLRGSPYFMRLGTGIGAPKDGRIGVDFAGVVESVGEDVTDYAIGDRVFGGAAGAFAEYIAVATNRVAPIPDLVSFEQAASLPIAAVTALQALRDSGKLQAGEKVLINGASGGVGTYAVQIAKWMGAEVYGVCSTRNVDMVRALGADHVFDYTQESYIESDERFDLVVDMVGNHSVAANRRVLTPDGRFVLIGGPKGDWFAPFLRPLGALIQAPFVDQQLGMMIARMDGDDLATLAELMRRGVLTSMIDRRFALDQVADAIRYSEQGRARGKIIIEVR